MIHKTLRVSVALWTIEHEGKENSEWKIKSRHGKSKVTALFAISAATALNKKHFKTPAKHA